MMRIFAQGNQYPGSQFPELALGLSHRGIAQQGYRISRRSRKQRSLPKVKTEANDDRFEALSLSQGTVKVRKTL